VLYATVPVPATCKSLVTALLTAIGDPAAEKGSQITQTLRLKRYIEACKVELLILDEFQHFQDRESLRVLKTISDWLKVLMDETGVPMVLAGLPYSHTVLDDENNEQLRRRFALRIELAPFGFKTSRERQDFRRFLNIIDEKLPLAEGSDLADPATAFCIYEATDGVVAHVMKLIRCATVIALESRREKLTMEILSCVSSVILTIINNKSSSSTCVPWDGHLNDHGDNLLLTSCRQAEVWYFAQGPKKMKAILVS
jgi:DNA transposition AAA+ family ATPase